MSGEPETGTRQRLSRPDWRLIAICIAVVLAALAIIVRYFDAAFPQSAIEFRFDRNSSAPIAERLLRAQHLDITGMKHAARFDSDDTARIFLERSLGLEKANAVLSRDVRASAWHHRWFKPLVEEELSVDVAPTGEIVGFTHHIPEDRAAPAASPEPPVAFLRSIAVKVEGLTLIDQSERRLPKRVQRIFTWESASIRPAGAQYRHTVTVDGNLITSYSQRLKVPDAWIRSYRELRSKNAAAGAVDTILLVVTMIGAVVVFIIRLRRGDLPLRFLLGVGIAAIVLTLGVSLNSMPAQLAYYDTTTSYPAFLGNLAFQAVVSSLGTAIFLVVVCGAGEVLYRERLPRELAIPRIWTRRSLTSRKVFLSLIVGYSLVPLFIAYQVLFYLIAHRFGAWAPAEVPYDETLNSALPWMAVLFAGFFPALSEEFLSRAFSIPFFQKIVRWRFAAIVIAAFIWGFGHATYPNQPFWIRGVEVGIAGIVAGLVMERFGLLPLLIWHYTIDAVYSATLLFGSGNTYYVVSAAASSLLFAIPLVLSVVLYLRNRGFVPDDELTNAAMPPSEAAPPAEAAPVATPFPEAPPVSRARIALCLAAVAAACVAVAVRPASPQDAADYRISGDQAKEIAKAHLRVVLPGAANRFAYVIATPVEGFRSWNPDSGREDGGAPSDFDETAATWMVRHGLSTGKLLDVFRHRIEAGTWMVRFFTPMQKEEVFIEVDPRSSRVAGFHRYQDEGKAGPALTQEQAATLARAEFPRYGLSPAAFDVKEALTFQQPRRRDWLFHFEERVPILSSAHRRVTVRVAGNEVTQFNKTIKVPDSVYREASTQTLLNLILFALKIAGIVALLALVITGLVVVTRAHGLPWRRALRWTLVLAIIPVAGFAARLESMLFGYSTTVAWETFRIGLITSFIRDVGLQVGLLFLALAGLEATVPYALSLPRKEGRARFGRGAAIATLTALSLLAAGQVALKYFALAFPSSATVSFSAPEDVATPLPALINGTQALFGAIVLSGAVALYAATLRKHAALVTTLALFCMLLDPSSTPAEMPLMLVRAAIVAAAVWLIARYVLDGNPLAWPLAVFTGALLGSAATLLQNQRTDLIANGWTLILFALVVLVWILTSTSGGPPETSPAVLRGR